MSQTSSKEQSNVLIIGASGGIGKAVVEKYLNHGYQVSGTSRTGEAPDGVLGIKADVTEPESIPEAIETHVSTYGSLETLVYCAGITRDNLLIMMSDEQIEEVLHVNLTAPIRAVRSALRPMLKNKGGSIVLVSSVSARFGVPGQTNYTASKAGLEGFSRSAAKEYAKKGIRINCVAPGPTETPMLNAMPEGLKAAMLELSPMGRAATPGEVADAIFDISEMTAVTGATLPVSGGGGYGY